MELNKGDWLNTKDSANDLLKQHEIGKRINQLIVDYCDKEIKQIEEIECLDDDNVLNSDNRCDKDNKKSNKESNKHSK